MLGNPRGHLLENLRHHVGWVVGLAISENLSFSQKIFEPIFEERNKDTKFKLVNTNNTNTKNWYN